MAIERNQEHPEKLIIQAWDENGRAWIDAVRDHGIRAPGVASRDALLAAINGHVQPNSRVLDVGCGEGWLVDLLTGSGYRVVGVDASRELIEYAQEHRKGHYVVGDQSDLAKLGLGIFDLVVCNFSLFGDETVRQCVMSVPQMLTPGGVLIIQTLHPAMFSENEVAKSGWREGTWADLPGDFGEPSPLYVRTLDDWSRLFSEAGLGVSRMLAPTAGNADPKSLIFVVSRCERTGQ